MRYEIIHTDASPTGQPQHGQPGNGGQTYGDVGSFQLGNSNSRWALSRYLLGRVIGEYISQFMLYVGLVIFGLAAVSLAFSHGVLAGIFLVLGFFALMVRSLFSAVLRRLTGAGQFGAVEEQVRQIVRATRHDLRQELRRVGVPSSVLTAPLLLLRLARARTRSETVARLRRVEIGRAVPAHRLDELHLAVDQLLHR